MLLHNESAGCPTDSTRRGFPLGVLGDLDSNQGFPSQSRKFYR